MSKKLYRRIHLEHTRQPYYRREGENSLYVHFLINARSHSGNYVQQCTETVVTYFKHIGFFNWYPGRHVRGKLIHTCPFSSFFVYAKEALRVPLAHINTRPFFGSIYMEQHGITIKLDGKLWPGVVRDGWCWVDLGEETACLKLVAGRWEENSRYKNRGHDDLPF